MNLIILIRTPLYYGTGGGVENGTILLTDYFLKAGINVSLLSRWQIDSSKDYYFRDQTSCFPDSFNPMASENIDFVQEIEKKYPQAVVWDRGGSMVDFLSVCRLNTSWHTLTSLHGNILSMFDCFTSRIEEASCKKRLIRYAFYPLFSFRYYHQYVQHLNHIACESQICIVLVPALIGCLKHLLSGKTSTEFTVIPDPLKYPIAQEEILQIKEKRIVLCSRLEHSSKRIDYFLQVWRKIQNHFPDWEVSIVGGPGKNISDWVQKREMEYLKHLCCKWNLKRVIFHDYQDPVLYYKKSAIYAMTSRHEGLPNSMQEAQSFGCAVVCFNSFLSASVLVKDGINGYLAKPFSIQDYADKLSKIMMNEDLRISMGKAALENAKQYSLDKIGQQWIELFQKILKDG